MTTTDRLLHEFAFLGAVLRAKVPLLEPTARLLPTLVFRNERWIAGVVVEVDEVQHLVSTRLVCAAHVEASQALRMALAQVEKLPPRIEVEELLRR